LNVIALALALQVHAAPTIGDRFEPFSLPTLEDSVYSWTPGRVTILTFCAFWCDTWKEQLPEVARAEQALGALPIDSATISVDGRWSDQGRKAAVGRMLCDNGMAWTRKLGIDRVPYTLVLDSSGTVRWAVSGEISANAIVNQVRRALKPAADGGTVYLTFDDFPAASGNDELLDVLRRLDIKATIFCICSKASRFDAVMKRAASEGNELEVHAWIHGEPKTDLARCDATLEQLGAHPSLFRPSGKETILTRTGDALPLKVVNPYDYARPSPAELIRRVTHQVAPGTVIQLHAGVTSTLEALPGLIENLRARGFKFDLMANSPLPPGELGERKQTG